MIWRAVETKEDIVWCDGKAMTERWWRDASEWMWREAAVPKGRRRLKAGGSQEWPPHGCLGTGRN